MPFAAIDDGSLYYRIDSSERSSSPALWLLLCNSLGTTSDMWRPQAAMFGAHFRVLRYDRRGHGRSSAPPGPCSIEDLGRDALAVMDQAGAERVYFCGLSIGGLVGQWLALNAPQRVERLVLCSTAAKIGTQEAWRLRIEQVRAQGLREVAEGAVARWFTPHYRTREPLAVNDIRQQLLNTSVDAYAACCQALIDADFRKQLRRVTIPTLTVAGLEDPVTVPSELRFIADEVADGHYVELPGAHLCNVESPAKFNNAVLKFLLS